MKTYIVKRGNEYAGGERDWTSDQKKAWRFDEPGWASAHAGTFAGARVVRLIKPRRVDRIVEKRVQELECFVNEGLELRAALLRRILNA